MSKDLSREQVRNQKVIDAIKIKGKATINDLALYFKIKPEQNFLGRKLKLIVADLVYSKQIKVTPGRNPVYAVNSIVSKKQKPETIAKPESFDLQAELEAATKSSSKPKLSVLGPGKKVIPISQKESKVIPLSRPEPQIAPYPVIGNLAAKPAASEKVNVSPYPKQQVDSEEAFKVFELAFSKNPDRTLDTLVKVVFEQQRKLERQEKLIKALHKLLGDYLAG